jgi:uncharacterized protein (DUF58 family)
VSAEFVAVLARLLTRHGNRVGALLYGSQVDACCRRARPPHVLHLLQRMRSYAAPQRGARRSCATCCARRTMIPRRSMVFVVSDFISAPAGSDALARLAQRHEVLAVRLYDAAELELPDLGLVTIQDAETGEQLFVDTHDPGFRERFVQLPSTRDAAARALTAAGVDTLELATDDDLVDAYCASRRCAGSAAGLAAAAAAGHLLRRAVARRTAGRRRA